jgi:hypothetical protein
LGKAAATIAIDLAKGERSRSREIQGWWTTFKDGPKKGGDHGRRAAVKPVPIRKDQPRRS